MNNQNRAHRRCLLGDAPFLFASEAARDAQEEADRFQRDAPEQILSGTALAKRKPDYQNLPENGQALLKLVGLTTMVVAGFGDGPCQIDIRQQLVAGELFAFGFVMPRKPTDSRVRVPEDVLRAGKFQWRKNAITGNGLQFIDVVVQQTIPSDRPHEQVSLPAAKKNGRPSVKEPLEAAFHEALQTGAIDLTQPKTATYRVVETLAVEKHGLSQRPSQSTSGKYLSRLIDAERIRQSSP